MEPEAKEDGYPVTYTTSEMPTFTSSQYSGDIHGYYTEVEWQNSSLEASSGMYSLAPRSDVPGLQYYSSYQPVSHPELYQSPALWSDGSGLHVTGSNASSPHGMSRRESARNGTSSARPKRRRTQSVVQRRAANVRERRRMFQLNEAFDELRLKLPAFNYEKRLSRIETLRLAMTYISFMQQVTSGADPKQVKLLKYATEESDHPDDHFFQNGVESADEEDNIDMTIQDEHLMDAPPSLKDVSAQPSLICLAPDQAVRVELLPIIPAPISLPVSNHVIATKPGVEYEVVEEEVEANCPSN